MPFLEKLASSNYETKLAKPAKNDILPPPYETANKST